MHAYLRPATTSNQQKKKREKTASDTTSYVCTFCGVGSIRKDANKGQWVALITAICPTTMSHLHHILRSFPSKHAAVTLAVSIDDEEETKFILALNNHCLSDY